MLLDTRSRVVIRKGLLGGSNGTAKLSGTSGYIKIHDEHFAVAMVCAGAPSKGQMNPNSVIKARSC